MQYAVIYFWKMQKISCRYRASEWGLLHPNPPPLSSLNSNLGRNQIKVPPSSLLPPTCVPARVWEIGAGARASCAGAGVAELRRQDCQFLPELRGNFSSCAGCPEHDGSRTTAADTQDNCEALRHTPRSWLLRHGARVQTCKRWFIMFGSHWYGYLLPLYNAAIELV